MLSSIILSNLLVPSRIPSISSDQIFKKKTLATHRNSAHVGNLNPSWSGASACSSFTIRNDHPSLITKHPSSKIVERLWLFQQILFICSSLGFPWIHQLNSQTEMQPSPACFTLVTSGHSKETTVFCSLAVENVQQKEALFFWNFYKYSKHEVFRSNKWYSHQTAHTLVPTL